MCNKLLCPRHYTKCSIRSNSFNPHNNNNNNNNTIIIPILQKTEDQINHLPKIIRLVDKTGGRSNSCIQPFPWICDLNHYSSESKRERKASQWLALGILPQREMLGPLCRSANIYWLLTICWMACLVFYIYYLILLTVLYGRSYYPISTKTVL